MQSMNRPWRSRAALAVALVVAASAGATMWQHPTNAQEKPVPATEQNEEAQSHAKQLSRAFRTAAEATIPSVVTITSETKSRQVRGNLRGQDPFKGTPFEGYFNDRDIPFNAPEKRTGVGAGVIIGRSGIILTNNHVVDGATEVTVRLSDGREFKASDIKTDKQTDLAVVRIKDAGSLSEAKLGNSDDLEIGDWVIAVGNPFNQEMTVSAGIISGKGRTLSGEQRAQYLQTDAAINPGNSGGPLVNLDGEVVGINTAIASSSGGFQGVGFAIPINQAKWVAEHLIKGGTVKRAYLGVKVGEVSGDLAQQFGVKRHEGVLVGEVLEDSPAAKAGIEEGDVILEFDGKPIARPGDLQQLVERTPLDGKKPVKLLRDGKAKTVMVGVEAMPDEPKEEVRKVHSSDNGRSSPSFASKELGLEVSDVTEQDAEHLGLKGHQGVLITDVAEGGLASEEGLSQGMMITKVGSKKVANIEEFKNAMADQSTEKGVLLWIRTANGTRFVVLKD